MIVMFIESSALLNTLEKFVLGLVQKVSMKFNDFLFFYHVITASVLKHVYGAASYHFTFLLRSLKPNKIFFFISA